MVRSSFGRLRVHAGLFSWWLGLAAVGLVACLWFPTLFTSPEGRELYPLPLIAAAARVLAIFACATGLLSINSARQRQGLIGLGLALVALLGAAAVRLVAPTTDAGVFGLDWLVIDGLVMVLVLVPLEAARPHRPRPATRAGWGTDTVYFIINHLAVRWIGGLGFVGALAATTHHHGALAQLPLALQLVLLLIVTDLVQYALHRAMHEVPWLWRLHAVHHASEHMDALAGSRIHFMESVIERTTIFLVGVSLGLAPVVFLIYGGLIALQGSLIHANVSLRYGWLERLIVSPRYHHWHHSSDREAIDTNYAGTFPFIDRLFGTHHLPAERWPERYGVVKEQVPPTLIAQQLFPFKLEQPALRVDRH